MSAPTSAPIVTLKTENGKKLASKECTSIYSALADAVIDGTSHLLVTVEPAQAGDTVSTGYVAESVLQELDVTTVEIPANFAGLEDKVVPTRLKEQLFEITKVVEEDGYVEVTALHIFYQLRQNNTLWEADKTLQYTGAAACRNVLGNAMFDAKFHVASDCTDKLSGEELDYARMNIVEAFLNPESGICARYGLSIIRDNDVFYCLKNVGYDRGFVVQDKKNLLGVERTVNIENTVTRIAPVGKDADGNIVWLNNNGSKYIDSPHIGDYAEPKLGIYDTGLWIGHNGVTAENIQEKLLAEGQKQFTDNEVDKPEVTMEIRFISLGDTEEYIQYRNLDKVYLYDILSIKDTERGYSYQAEVVSVDHDILTGRLEGVTIGTLQDWNGIRKVATWQIPEVNGEKLRLKSIKAGSFGIGSVRASDIATNAIQSSHFSESADGHFNTIFAEQLYISNTSEDGLLNTRFSVSEGNIEALVEKTGIDYLPAGTSIYGQLSVEAGKVAMVVGTNSGGNYIKAAEIATSINNAGQGVALINADHVNISATSTAYTLAGELERDANGKLIIKSAGGLYVQRTDQGVTAQFGVFDDGTLTAGVIATKVNGVSSTNIYADKILMSSTSGANNVQVEVNGKITANDITAQFINSLYASAGTFTCVGITASGNIVASGGVTGSGIYVSNNGSTVSISDPILDVKIADPVNNVYKLQYKSVSHQSWTDAGSFSRATALSGAWSSGIFTVSASPQGNSLSTNLVQGTASWNGNTVTIPVEAIDSDNPGYQYATGRDISLTGVTNGTFSSVTAKPIVQSGGTMYYPAESAVTLYNAGSTTKVDRGSTVVITPISSTTAIRLGSSGTYYTKKSSKGRLIGNQASWDYYGPLYPKNSSTPIGSGYWYLNQEMYYKGDEVDVVDSSVTARPVVSSGGTVYYQAASQVTWYKGDGGSFTVQGSSTSVTPIASASGVRLGASEALYRKN